MDHPALNPHEALRQIAEIRERMAGSQVFRGFRSLAVAFSGVTALLAAVCQQHLVPAPAENLERYLLLWVGVAALDLLVAGLGLWSWSRTAGSGLARERAVLAAELVLPPLIVGALLTLSIVRSAPEVAWMLPGTWSLLFSLAVFASRRILSPEVRWVALYYVASGAACLLLGGGDASLAPWQMGLCFGGGQLLGASILFWTVERRDAAQEER
jgi:hypothetical protein